MGAKDPGDGITPGHITIIAPKHGWLDVPWRELWARRELFLILAARDLRVRYKQTVMGALWSLAQPLASMLVLTIFFGRIARLPSDGIPYPVFALAGLTLWTLFSNALVHSTNSLVANASLLNKVYFPRLLLPASAVLVALVDSLIGTGTLLAVMLIVGSPLGAEMALFVPLLVLVALLGLGVGLLLSNANAKYRDVRQAVPLALQLAMFMSPIFYPSSMIPEPWRAVYALNPMTAAIDAGRALAAGRAVAWAPVGRAVVMTVGVLALGIVTFRRGEQDVADAV